MAGKNPAMSAVGRHANKVEMYSGCRNYSVVKMRNPTLNEKQTDVEKSKRFIE